MDDKNKTWSKVWSKTYQAFYWFDERTGEKSWTIPNSQNTVTTSSTTVIANTTADVSVTQGLTKKRIFADTICSSDRKVESRTKNSENCPNVAIIVPFRDLHVEQNRRSHLTRFISELPAIISSKISELGYTLKTPTFQIIIVEQSNDNRKFNRGKLLNIGFEISRREFFSNVFIFHDVDLLPSSDLVQEYFKIPSDNPIHIARVWSRYNKNPRYFGGIVSFSEEMYVRINGFPNNFWGWGGEDDEMYNRVQEVGLSPIAPNHGDIVDMENMQLDTKLLFLKSHSHWKCMNKNEVLKEHEETWKQNGISNLKFKELHRETMSEHCIKITVDVELNDHWTDSRCGEHDMQYTPCPDPHLAPFVKIKNAELN